MQKLCSYVDILWTGCYFKQKPEIECHSRRVTFRDQAQPKSPRQMEEEGGCTELYLRLEEDNEIKVLPR
jgi:hypothetical protein